MTSLQTAVASFVVTLGAGLALAHLSELGASEPDASACSPAIAGSAELRPGVFVLSVRHDGLDVWLYSPCARDEPLPLVLVGPAGSDLVTGMPLAEADRPEHIPYVEAGYAVVAYEIAGAPRGPSDQAYMNAMAEFRDARAGVESALAALDLALDTYPSIEDERIFAAGHSSAATLALRVALDRRIAAVAAYAPVTDVEAHLADIIAELNAAVPGMESMVRESSPIRYAHILAHKPVFLFHALEDRVADPDESATLFAAMENRHPASVRVTTHGDHYTPMIEEGIPAAIAWFDALE